VLVLGWGSVGLSNRRTGVWLVIERGLVWQEGEGRIARGGHGGYGDG